MTDISGYFEGKLQHIKTKRKQLSRNMVTMTSVRHKTMLKRLATRYGPIALSFLLGWLLGQNELVSLSKPNIRSGRSQNRARTKLSSFVQHLSDVPVRNTAHVDPRQGQSITKQQFLDPFVIPNVAGISVATIQKGQEVTMHSHSTMHEFFYVLEGTAVFTVEDDHGTQHRQEVQPGSFAYFSPPDRHGIQVAADSPGGDLKVLLAGVIVE